MPRETRVRCATAPFATRARPFALAATSLVLRSFYNHKGHCFAERATFGDSYALAFFYVEARGVVSVDVAVAAFISFEFGHIKLVVSSHHDGFVHFRTYDNPV